MGLLLPPTKSVGAVVGSGVVQAQWGDVGSLGEGAPRLGVDRGMLRMPVRSWEHQVVLLPGGTGGKLLSGPVAAVLAQLLHQLRWNRQRSAPCT